MSEPFDPKKDIRNQIERGLSLATGLEVLKRRVVEFEDRRFEYGERWIVCFEYVSERLNACVYTVRADGPRIRSVREADDRERRRYGEDHSV